jgi:hypothetical protein
LSFESTVSRSDGNTQASSLVSTANALDQATNAAAKVAINPRSPARLGPREPERQLTPMAAGRISDGIETIELEARGVKTTPNDTDTVHMPPELLAEARKAASEEHRPADELVSDAVRHYLESRRGERRQNSEAPVAAQTKRTLLDLFKPLRGLDVEFTRNPSTGRPVDL